MTLAHLGTTGCAPEAEYMKASFLAPGARKEAFMYSGKGTFTTFRVGEEAFTALTRIDIHDRPGREHPADTGTLASPATPQRYAHCP
ncbi:hypothetical protein AORI_6570 [Amycolatopsis keratiniphila]|uniref:Uncharacterized protein n=1 Tax=Amycolatopsis keratiniphila TaxID=129921 RepID=R4TFN8_9PSEU|nr:hypothetical protein AORI_6570 [Amycolatopsis keratiniphila]